MASHLHPGRAASARSDNYLAHKVFLNLEPGKVGTEGGAQGSKLGGRGCAGSDGGDPPLLGNIGNTSDGDGHAAGPLSLGCPRSVSGSQIPRPFTPVSRSSISSGLRRNQQGGSLISLPQSGRTTPVQFSSSYSRTRACHQRRGSADVGKGPSSMPGSGVSRIPISIHQQPHHHHHHLRSRETLSLSLSGSADSFEVLG